MFRLKPIGKMHYLKSLEESVRNKWDKICVCNYGGEEFSYADVASHIEKFHLFFEKLGIVNSDHIALCAKNTARWAISFLAVNTYGTVVVPILCDFLPDSINHLVDHSESKILFTDSDIWEKLDISQMPGLKAVVSVNEFKLLFASDDSVREAFDGVEAEFAEKYPNGFSAADVTYQAPENDKDLALINYTSGTTSAPKGVMLRFEGIDYMLKFCYDYCYCDGNDAIVSMLPMGHIYGLIIEFLYPICHSCKICFLGRTPSPTLLLKAMKDTRPYQVATVPLVMEKVYKSSIKPVISKWPMKILLSIPGVNNILYAKIGDKLKAAFGGQVRMFIMGGAAVNPEVERCFRRIGLPFTVGYGMTEASPLLAYEGWQKFVLGSCGKPIPGCDVRIDSEDPEHVVGEIQAKGPNICSGYFKNEEATAGAFTADGYLKTGDLGIMDKDGNIFIKGRSKNMILTANGQNIYPEEAEAVINAQPYVAESVVVDREGKLVALVYLDSDRIRKEKLDEKSKAEIPEATRVNSNKLLPGYSQISKVEIVNEPFEKTPKLSIKRFLYK